MGADPKEREGKEGVMRPIKFDFTECPELNAKVQERLTSLGCDWELGINTSGITYIKYLVVWDQVLYHCLDIAMVFNRNGAQQVCPHQFLSADIETVRAFMNNKIDTLSDNKKSEGCWNPKAANCDCPACGGFND